MVTRHRIAIEDGRLPDKEHYSLKLTELLWGHVSVIDFPFVWYTCRRRFNIHSTPLVPL